MGKNQKAICCGLAAALALAPIAMPLNAAALSQDETVYAKLLPSGEVDYVSVTEHLQNDQQADKITTKTVLDGIENLNGFEGFTLNGENLIWEAKGKDIYYSGKTTQDLPVALKVTYTLNGENKSLTEMLGKSGQVEIKLHYTNKSKIGDLYTPFVAAVSTTLPEDSVRNVAVTNGKAISNGRTVAVAAVVAPGLYDSLKLDELKNLDEVVIIYDTDKFELNDIYSIVTPKILDDNDLKIFSELDGLYADADKLASGSKDLVAGTTALRDGVAEMSEALAEAKQQLASMGKFLNETTLDQIAYTAASSALRQVAAQQSTIRAQIHTQISNLPELEALQNASTMLNNLAANLVEQLTVAQTPAQCVNFLASQNEAQTAGALPLSAVASCNDPTSTTYQTVAAQVRPVVEQQVASQMQSLNLPTLNVAGIEEKLFQSMYGAMVNVAETTAAQTARQVASQVDDSIRAGLSDKLEVLMDAMMSGVNKLLDGANELNNGMQKFDREGIQTLNNFVNNKVRNTSNKLERLTKLADEYNNYAGIADDAKGSTKFILMIDGKKAE